MMNVSIVAINLWWVKRRGVMMGIAGACVSLGAWGGYIPDEVPLDNLCVCVCVCVCAHCLPLVPPGMVVP